MTTGFLWTGQYEEAKRVIEKGNNQSMELDEQTLEGHWSTDVNNGMDFFIINDAIFSKLCILGEDVEPCFEGASVTAPQISNSFSKVDDNFKQTLFTMMQDLKFALEGGKNMKLEEKTNEVVEEVETTEEAVETVEEVEQTEEAIAEEEPSIEAAETEFTAEEDGEATPSEEIEENMEEEENNESEAEIEEEISEEPAEEEIIEEVSLEEYTALKNSYSELETKYNELVEFKKQIDLQEKMNLINSFYMLSDEDKAEVKEHINEYSKDEIESKLSVICVRKKVNFDQDNSDKNEINVEEVNSAVTTFNLEDTKENVPDWVAACINTQNSTR